jgi:hypothetical protein
MSDEVNILANEEIDYAITMAAEFSKLFRTKSINSNHMEVQMEADFYLGAAWATASNFFTFDFAKRFRRAPAPKDNLVLISALFKRNAEIKNAISILGLL